MNDDSATVQREFRILAEQGNYEAQYFWELMYGAAQDVQEDSATASKCGSRAVEQENAQAQC